jgi:hypothetical protein
MIVTVSLRGEVKDFPKLMISDDLVVLFTRTEVGVVIIPEGDYKIGEYGEVFRMEYFTDYNGEITLKNE